MFNPNERIFRGKRSTFEQIAQNIELVPRSSILLTICPHSTLFTHQCSQFGFPQARSLILPYIYLCQFFFSASCLPINCLGLVIQCSPYRTQCTHHPSISDPESTIFIKKGRRVYLFHIYSIIFA